MEQRAANLIRLCVESIHCRLLALPVEIQLDIIDLDLSAYLIWPLLSKQAAMTIRYDDKMNKHGKWQRRMRKNNKLTEEHFWSHGVEHGEWKRWYDNGQLLGQCNYVNGKQEGEYNRWYNNGQLYEQRYYVNGVLEPKFKRWRADGTSIK
mmetsp:Transcript_11463/g.12579  ORF Transcript_11463/g.12579 Transcript_11463/m.12579 type:complete len:150 (-) Transcript_11463:47-496(-)